jgi:hypothetical protein
MKNEDLDTMFGGINLPTPEHIKHQQELKIPLLSYKRSSRVGLWLLLLPVIVAITVILKYELGIFSPFLDAMQHFFGAVDRNPFLTYFIPLILVGLPFLVMMMNLLAFCHFTYIREEREFLVTIKLRPLNIALFLFSFAIFVYFFLPDRLSF